MTCIPGCTDCCGPAPVADEEAERIRQRYPLLAHDLASGITAVRPGTLTCVYAADGRGCRIHDERPVVCRMFGVVDHPRMTCPHGRGPRQKMPQREARRLLGRR
jgi:Fe-S-cluster containining protein